MILFSSHILQEVAAISDRVLVLHQGKLVANQPIELLTQSSQANLLVQFQEDMTDYLPLIQLKYKLLDQSDKHVLVIEAKEAQVLDQARQYLLALALEKGLHIERLQTQEASLEEIFKLDEKGNITNLDESEKEIIRFLFLFYVQKEISKY